MAFLATVQWDVRTTGDDANGGGFDPTAGVPGTDYSQQTSPQVTYTDLVIDGTTNTKCTSAGTPFTSAHVGNVINITSGTGFTVQRVQIISVSGSTATCDKSLGTLSSTGGNGKLGGSLLTIGAANTLLVSGNTVHIKAGTYTLTSTIVLVSAQISLWIGYSATHGDGGTKPLITTATNSTPLFTIYGSDVAWFINLSMSNTASTRSDAMRASPTNGGTLFVRDCLLDGFDKAINGDNGSATWVFGYVSVVGTEIKNSVTSDLVNDNTLIRIDGCYFHGSTNYSVRVNAGGGPFSTSISRTVFASSTKQAIFYDTGSATLELLECSFYNAGLAGSVTSIQIDVTSLVTAVNCIFYGGSGSYFSSNVNILGRNNARDSVGIGSTNYHSFADVVLTSGPFTSSSDFSLNATAGGGAGCKAMGFSGVAPFSTTAALDIGAVQTTGGGGGGGGGSVAANPLGGFVA